MLSAGKSVPIIYAGTNHPPILQAPAWGTLTRLHYPLLQICARIAPFGHRRRAIGAGSTMFVPVLRKPFPNCGEADHGSTTKRFNVFELLDLRQKEISLERTQAADSDSLFYIYTLQNIKLLFSNALWLWLKPIGMFYNFVFILKEEKINYFPTKKKSCKNQTKSQKTSLYITMKLW